MSLYEKRAHELSKMLGGILGGGSEWFSAVGGDFYIDPKLAGDELSRRKTDAHITKGALVRANRNTEAQEAENARLKTALKTIAGPLGNEPIPGDRGYSDISAVKYWRQIAIRARMVANAALSPVLIEDGEARS